MPKKKGKRKENIAKSIEAANEVVVDQSEAGEPQTEVAEDEIAESAIDENGEVETQMSEVEADEAETAEIVTDEAEAEVAEEAENAEAEVAEEAENAEELDDLVEKAIREEIQNGALESDEDTDEEADKAEKEKELAEAKKLSEVKSANEAGRELRSKESARAKELAAKRQARHRRRVKNQIISYVTVFVLLCVIGVAGFTIIKKVHSLIADKLPSSETIQEVVDNLAPMDSETAQGIIDGMMGSTDTPVDTGNNTPEETPVIESEPEPEPEPEPAPDEPDGLDLYVRGIIANMSLEDKVAGLFLTTPESITNVTLATMAGEGTRTALETYRIGGIVYASRNMLDMDQFGQMIANTNGFFSAPTFLAVAEEGGQISPLSNLGFGDVQLSASEIGATFDVNEAYNAGLAIGSTMAGIGLNLNLAPVADLASIPGNILGDRSYGETAVNTTEFVKSMVQGLNEQGITSCLKYFPGVGCTASNPAYGRVVVDRSADDFRSKEFLVYQACIESGTTEMIMLSNIIVSAFDEEYPVSLSEIMVTDILRSELGYKGVVLSGNLSEAAITDYYDSKTAAIYALKAGCDMLYCPENFEEAYNGIIAAVGEGVVSEARIDDALARIYRIKYADANY